MGLPAARLEAVAWTELPWREELQQPSAHSQAMPRSRLPPSHRCPTPAPASPVRSTVLAGSTLHGRFGSRTRLPRTLTPCLCSSGLPCHGWLFDGIGGRVRTEGDPEIPFGAPTSAGLPSSSPVTRWRQMDDWSCTECAFNNIGTMRRCDMCDASRSDQLTSSCSLSPPSPPSHGRSTAPPSSFHCTTQRAMGTALVSPPSMALC